MRFFLNLLLLAGCGASTQSERAAALDDDEPSPVGTWYGGLRDIFDNPSDLCLELTQVGTPGVAGASLYTGTDNCGGTLTYIKTVGHVHSFDERQTSGGGCPDGLTTLTLKTDASLEYEFFLPGGASAVSSGVLDRVDACP